MKIYGVNVPRWLLGTTALAAVAGYYTLGYNMSQPDPRDMMVLDEVPAKVTGNLDLLVGKMQASPARYNKFVIVTDHGRPTHAWLVGKDRSDDEYALIEPVESALNHAYHTAGHFKCELNMEPAGFAGKVIATPCLQRFTSEDTAIAKAEREKAKVSVTDYLIRIAGTVIPIGLFGGWWYWQTKNGGFGGRSQRKITKAKLELIEPTDDKKRITFADVKGLDGTVAQLKMILTCLKNPKLLAELGGMLQKGLLLVGPPGTGKTLLGRAIAGEAEIPFYSIGGADFQEMFVGVGSARVDDMFAEIAEKVRVTGKPVILFVDEIDALLRTRTGAASGNSEKDDTVAAFLKKMDGLVALGKVLIIGATNVPEQLDKAATRDGRFGEQIKVLSPNRKGLLEIIKYMLGKVLKLSTDVAAEELASEFFDNRFTGADCMGVILERAPILALMRIEQTGGEKALTMADIMLALDKKMLGDIDLAEEVPKDFERLVTKHELGHLITVLALNDKSTGLGNTWSKPVKSISIRGPQGKGGSVQTKGEGDIASQSRKELRGKLIVTQGGTASEELHFGDWSIGDKSDEQQAERVADYMVTRFRMSPNRMLPPISIDEPGASLYLGGQGAKPAQYGLGPDSSNQIDEAKGILTRDGHAKARALVRLYKGFIEYMYPILFKKKMMKADEIETHWRNWKEKNPIDLPEWLTNDELWNAFWDDRAEEPPTVAQFEELKEREIVFNSIICMDA